MIQIFFTVCFGALAGWFVFTLSPIKKGNMTALRHILFGIAGGLLGLALFQFYIHTTTSGRELYGLILSLVGSLAAINIGRRVTRL